MRLLRKQPGGVSNWQKAWGRAPRHATIMLLIASVLFVLPSCSSGESKPFASEAPASANVSSPGESKPFASEAPASANVTPPGESKPFTSEAPASANVTSPREFPSFVYNSARVLQAYETAVQIPEVLLLMPCYCGCSEAHDHKNLKDCFFKEDGSLNDHAAFCDICDWEVADIAKWQGEGYSSKQIRQLIIEKYSSWGEPTDIAPFPTDIAPSDEGCPC